MNKTNATPYIACALLALTTCTIQAADEQTEAQMATTAYTTQNGDTLTRIVQKQFRDSPLQTAVIAARIQQINSPQIGNIGVTQRLRAGLQLQLPVHDTLVRQVLEPYAAPKTGKHPDESSPKRWIRYP